MRKILVPVLGALLAVALPAVAVAGDATEAPVDEAARLTEARAIIAIMFPPEQREQMLVDVMGQLVSQMRQGMPPGIASDPGLKAILDETLDSIPERGRPLLKDHLPAIMEATATAYTHEFSLDELKQIHAFAQTPAGTHYLSRSSSLIGDPAVAKANAAYLTDVQLMSRDVEEEVTDKVEAYLKAHPEVLKKLTKKSSTK